MRRDSETVTQRGCRLSMSTPKVTRLHGAVDGDASDVDVDNALTRNGACEIAHTARYLAYSGRVPQPRS